MTFLLVSFLALLSVLGAVSLKRLWSALPDSNIDFDLTPADVDLEHRS